MERKVKENVDNILYQIDSAKKKGKKSIKVKVYQVSPGKGIMYCLSGLESDKEEGVQYLKENGYTVTFETNNKQTSLTYNMRGELASTSSKDLITVSIIIHW